MDELKRQAKEAEGRAATADAACRHAEVCGTTCVGLLGRGCAELRHTVPATPATEEAVRFPSLCLLCVRVPQEEAAHKQTEVRAACRCVGKLTVVLPPASFFPVTPAPRRPTLTPPPLPVSRKCLNVCVMCARAC
jgi:hypothetical protein